MQTILALTTIFISIAFAASPTDSAPPGFVTTYPSAFQITAVNSTIDTAKRDIAKREACPISDGSLVITLNDGVLTDQTGRIADIVSNFQFQFDPAPGQAGAIYTSGFSIGSNNSMALGSSTVFYECLSGTFYNLYDRSWASQCEPILIQVLPCDQDPSGENTDPNDTQPAATGVATDLADSQTPITVISDGQPQVPTAVISQLEEGQPQTSTTLAIPAMTSVTSDGQSQAPTMVATPTSSISGENSQAPASTATPIPISVISDGQPQAPTTMSLATVPPKSSSNGTFATPSPTQNITNGANTFTAGYGIFAIFLAIVTVLI